MPKQFTIKGLPNDLLTDDKVNVRRLKVETDNADELIVLKDKIIDLQTGNQEITSLLKAILSGIEIIADQDEGSLLEDIEQD